MNLNILSVIALLISCVSVFVAQLTCWTETARGSDAIQDMTRGYPAGWRDQHSYGWPVPLITFVPVGETTPDSYKIRFHYLGIICSMAGWGTAAFLANYPFNVVWKSWSKKDFSVSMNSLIGIVVSASICFSVSLWFIRTTVSMFLPNHASNLPIAGLFAIYFHLFFAIWGLFLFFGSKWKPDNDSPVVT